MLELACFDHCTKKLLNKFFIETVNQWRKKYKRMPKNNIKNV